jgi:hypothetical protein
MEVIASIFDNFDLVSSMSINSNLRSIQYVRKNYFEINAGRSYLG